MTVRATVTWTVNGEKIQYELATDAGYVPDVADDLVARVTLGLREAVAAVRSVPHVPE